MSVAQSHPHWSNLPKDAGWTAKSAVAMVGCVAWSYYRGQGDQWRSLMFQYPHCPSSAGSRP
jgi:hypothetical protein